MIVDIIKKEKTMFGKKKKEKNENIRELGFDEVFEQPDEVKSTEKRKKMEL